MDCRRTAVFKRLKAQWNRLRRSSQSNRIENRDPGCDPDLSERIRERYDTARKVKPPTKQWLRNHGVRDDWDDAWRATNW
jgi:hypothetical protein